MRKKLIAAFLTVVFVLNMQIWGKDASLKIIPEKPKAGTEITVLFDASGTLIEKAKEVEVTVCAYSTEVEDTYSLDMKKEGNVWTTKLKVGDNTEILGLKFKGDEKEETNDGNGYYIKMTGPDGNETAGAQIGRATALSLWGYYIGADRDAKKAYDMMSNVFKTYPELKSKYMNDYLSSINGSMKEKGNDLIVEELTAFQTKKDLSENDYAIIYSWYGRIKNTGKAEEAKKIVLDKFPAGRIAVSERLKAVASEKDFSKKLEIIAQVEKDFPGNEGVAPAVQNLFYSLQREGKFKEGKELVDKYGAMIPAFYFGYYVNSILKSNKDLELALVFAEIGLDKARKELSNPTDKKPKTMTEKNWLEMRRSNLGSALSYYGKALGALDKNNEAVIAYEEAITLIPSEDLEPAILENYSKALIVTNQNEKATSKIEEAITAGLGTAEMKNMLKDLYVKKNGKEEGYDKYISKIEETAKEKLVAKLKDEMINQPAPTFTLLDLEGNSVSLADMKGKVVIIDFWATWCGPCLSSFPGMQKAVEKFAEDKNVQFLFLNTWERMEDKKKNAADFLVKTKYPFHVLMDDQDQVVASYKVSGIPTKFIIDKNGNIRFKSIGFGGNTDGLVEEISAMISLLQ